MDLKALRQLTADLNEDAAVTVSIHGALFEIAAIGTENHGHEQMPRIVLGLSDGGYRYRVGGRRG